MIRTADNMPDGYSPRRRAEISTDAYTPLSPMSPDSAADGTVSVDYEGWASINHQVDTRTLNGTNFTAFANQLRKQASNSPPCGQGAITPSGTYPGGGAFAGAVCMEDGRIYLIPRGTTARIYDPRTDTLTTPSGTFPGTATQYHGGVLLNDGRVFITPRSAATARIYDPRTDTLTTPAGTYNVTNGWYGSVLMADGRVYIVPFFNTTARIYDPRTNTLTTPAGTVDPITGTFYAGGVLLPDGRVFLVPAGSENGAPTLPAIYDPVADRLTFGSSFETGNDNIRYIGGVLLPDGRVFLVPALSPSARIYDPRNDSMFTVSGTYPAASNALSGGVLMPDGRVFCIPTASTTARIYDPVFNITTTPTDNYLGNNNFLGGCLMQDGRVFLVPFVSTTARIVGPRTGTISSNRILSPYLNKF